MTELGQWSAVAAVRCWWRTVAQEGSRRWCREVARTGQAWNDDRRWHGHTFARLHHQLRARDAASMAPAAGTLTPGAGTPRAKR